MTYTELSMASAGWGFELGSIAGDIVNNAKWGYTKRAYKAARVTDREIETIMFWAKKYGVDLKVGLDIAFASTNALRDMHPHRFAKVSCSSCGGSFGSGNAGFSHCTSHMEAAQ